MDELYHYTSFSVLKSIVENKCLWFSDVKTTNDHTEFKHGIEKFEKSRFANFDESSGENFIWRTLLKGAESEYEFFKGAFVCCFSQYLLDEICCCKKSGTLHCDDCKQKYDNIIKDGLLSQWRGYALNGNNSGCCIVFDKNKLIENFEKELKAEPLDGLAVGWGGKVNYNENKIDSDQNLRRGIADLNSKIFRTAGRDGKEKLGKFFSNEDNLQWFQQDLLKPYFSVALLNKNNSFHEEQEFRFAIVPAQKDSNKQGMELEVKYRDCDGVIKRRIEVNIEPKKVIKKIIVGPAKTIEIQNNNFVAMKEMLRQKGLSEIEVIKSEIPFV